MGLVRCLRSYMPDVEITLLTIEISKDQKFEEKVGVKLLRHPWSGPPRKYSGVIAAFRIFLEFWRCSMYRIAGIFNKRIKKPYDQYDIFIDGTLDQFNDADSGWRSSVVGLLNIFFEWGIFRKPTATVPNDIGPFTTKYTRWLARVILSRLDIVALRNKASYEYCEQLGLNKQRIYLTGDMAFLLEPVPEQKVKLMLQEEGVIEDLTPLIGFSANLTEMVSYSFAESMPEMERARKYIWLMASLINYVKHKLNGEVCIIPHDVNDIKLSLMIYEQLDNKTGVNLLRGEYLPDEIKGIISNCDIFISCRLHAAIAATSKGVPTLSIAYSAKYYRIIGEALGQGEYIVDIRNREPKELLVELKSKIDSLWENRDKVRLVLKERVKTVQYQAMLYGKIIKELMERK